MSNHSDNAQFYNVSFTTEQILILFKNDNLSLKEAKMLLERESKKKIVKEQQEEKSTDVFENILKRFEYYYYSEDTILCNLKQKDKAYRFVGNYLFKIQEQGLIWTANFVNQSRLVDNRRFSDALKSLEKNAVLFTGNGNDFVWDWNQHSTIWWNAQLLITLLEKIN